VTEISFYHLEKSNLEFVLPKLLEKVLEIGKRALVIGESEARIEILASALWTYNSGSWLPHGTSKDSYPEEQPVWLSSEDTNPNGATFLFLLNGMNSERVPDFERCFVLFDGNNPSMVDIARTHWSDYQKSGHNVTYWQQSSSGAWEKRG
tara:strand:+ start:202 stop:651 length:450 start_codon:yes stop_codon:yes gene_type:complete